MLPENLKVQNGFRKEDIFAKISQRRRLSKEFTRHITKQSNLSQLVMSCLATLAFLIKNNVVEISDIALKISLGLFDQ